VLAIFHRLTADPSGFMQNPAVLCFSLTALLRQHIGYPYGQLRGGVRVAQGP
jgi:hypothetical protein